MCDGRRLKKRKTSTKRNTLNPVYNEAIVFDVPPENIDQIHLSIAVMDYDRWEPCLSASLSYPGQRERPWILSEDPMLQEMPARVARGRQADKESPFSKPFCTVRLPQCLSSSIISFYFLTSFSSSILPTPPSLPLFIFAHLLESGLKEVPHESYLLLGNPDYL